MITSRRTGTPHMRGLDAIIGIENENVSYIPAVDLNRDEAPFANH